MLGYIEDVDDKLFKKYSDGQDFNSFINEFDHTTNKKDKEKIVKELKEINDMLYHYINSDENSEYRSKLIDIVNAIDFFCMNTLKNGWVILIGKKQSKIIIINKKIIFLCMYKIINHFM